MGVYIVCRFNRLLEYPVLIKYISTPKASHDKELKNCRYGSKILGH